MLPKSDADVWLASAFHAYERYVAMEKALLDFYQQVGRLTSLPLFAQATGAMSVDLLIEMFKTIPKGARLTWISDSCYSGDLARDLPRPRRCCNRHWRSLRAAGGFNSE